MPGNGQAYVESSVAHHVIYWKSIERRLLGSCHMILKSYVGRSLACPISIRESVIQHNTSLISTTTRMWPGRGVLSMKTCSMPPSATLTTPTRACTLQKCTYHKDMLATIPYTVGRPLGNSTPYTHL